MRLIGNVDGETSAKKFSDYLFVQGIENEIEAEPGGMWAVWIKSEEELERAKSILTGFRQNPTDAKFNSTAQAVQALREQKEKEQKAYENRIKGRGQLFRTMAGYGFGPLTFGLICLSIVVFIFRELPGSNPESFSDFFITHFDKRGFYLEFHPGLPEIRHGELWRLITPIFLHFGFLHIFFNMLWLRDLGSMIEGRQNTWLFAILVVVFAAGSNLTQYYFSTPDFGGMSGVNYALAGYIRMRGKRDPGSGLYLQSSTVTMMAIFAVVCLTGVMGAVANYAHFSGFAMGLAWGYLSSLRRR